MPASTNLYSRREVFRVDRSPMPPGTLVNPYYMASHLRLIDEARLAVDSGAPGLLDYLRTARIADANSQPEELPASDRLRMMIVLEAVFESVRLDICPHIPSRHEATFVWSSVDLAKRFRAEYLPTGQIHSCEISNGTATLRDGALLPPGINIRLSTVEELQIELARTTARAEQYWRGEQPMTTPELMVKGQVRIVSAMAD